MNVILFAINIRTDAFAMLAGVLNSMCSSFETQVQFDAPPHNFMIRFISHGIRLDYFKGEMKGEFLINLDVKFYDWSANERDLKNLCRYNLKYLVSYFDNTLPITGRLNNTLVVSSRETISLIKYFIMNRFLT